MPSDLTRELRELAPVPDTVVDVAQIWARSQKLRRRRALAYIFLSISIVVAGAGAAVGIPSGSPSTGFVPASSPNPSHATHRSDKVRARRAALEAELAKLRRRLGLLEHKQRSNGQRKASGLRRTLRRQTHVLHRLIERRGERHGPSPGR